MGEDAYLFRLKSRIALIGASDWGDEQNKQGVLSGLLAARELYVEHLEDRERAREAALAADREMETKGWF